MLPMPAAAPVCILTFVPRVTIYLDDVLAQQVRQLDESVSTVCQQALRAAIQRQELRGHPRHTISRVKQPEGVAQWPTNRQK